MEEKIDSMVKVFEEMQAVIGTDFTVTDKTATLIKPLLTKFVEIYKEYYIMTHGFSLDNYFIQFQIMEILLYLSNPSSLSSRELVKQIIGVYD